MGLGVIRRVGGLASVSVGGLIFSKSYPPSRRFLEATSTEHGKPQAVIRRVGGLEGTCRPHCGKDGVIRRVGGSEVGAVAFPADGAVIRRVGGLEVEHSRLR